MTSHSDISEQNIRANRAYHDYVAKNYERDPRVRLGAMHANSAKRLEWLQRQYAIPTDSSLVLNLGCGTGNLMKKADEIFGFTVGMDISLNMLKQAKRYTNSLVQADALKIPLKSESLSLVFCAALLHHIYDLKVFFGSVYRVLKPGGIFYSDYDLNRRFSQTIKRIPFFSFIFSSYKNISDKFIFTKEDKRAWRAIHDIAEYHEEFRNGLEPSEIVNIARRVGFSQIKWLCHCDSPDLNYPRRGRWIHSALDFLLSPFSKDYNDRAKIFSIIATK